MSGAKDGFWIVAAGLALLTLAPLWSVPFPPMVDLPQHAAQITLWQALASGDADALRLYQLNWFTPYLVGYSLARVFASSVPIVVALQLTVSCALLALPLSLLALCRATGADRWVALLGFPLAYGFCFYWGFLNYLIAIPLGVGVVALTYRYAAEPRHLRGLSLALLLAVLFFSHALVFAACGLAAALVLLLAIPRSLRGLVRFWPFLLPLPLVAAWVAALVAGKNETHLPAEWGPIWRRALEWPSLLLGDFNDVPAAAFVVGALVVLGSCGVHPRRWRAAWPPWAVALLVFFAFPVFGFGVALLYPRFAVLVAVFALGAVTLPETKRRRTLARVALVAVAAAWSCVLLVRFHTYGADADNFGGIVRAMDPDKRVRTLIFDPYAPGLPGIPVFMHFPAWYQAQRGGFLSFSFAEFFPELVRYRERPPYATAPGFETAPERFTWAREGPYYDYFLVRAHRDPADRLFRGNLDAVRLEQHNGAWWLYRNVRGGQR